MLTNVARSHTTSNDKKVARHLKEIEEILDETDIPVHQLYSSIEKTKELGLVKTRMDSKKYPPRNMVSLTAKGKKFSKKLEELIMILG